MVQNIEVLVLGYTEFSPQLLLLELKVALNVI